MNSFFKGITTGVIVGAAGAATAVTMLPKNNKSRRNIKQNTEKALKAVSGLIDNVQAMMD